MVLVAHGWVAVMGGPVRFLARIVSLRLQPLVPLGHYTSICYKGVKQQYFLLDLG